MTVTHHPVYTAAGRHQTGEAREAAAYLFDVLSESVGPLKPDAKSALAVFCLRLVEDRGAAPVLRDLRSQRLLGMQLHAERFLRGPR